MKEKLTIYFEESTFSVWRSEPYIDRKGQQKRKSVFIAGGDLSQEGCAAELDDLAQMIAEKLRAS